MGPFTNVQLNYYWSGTEYAPDTDKAWDILFNDGFQLVSSKSINDSAFAVRDGDTAPISEHSTALLFGVGLLGLGWIRRKAQRA